MKSISVSSYHFPETITVRNGTAVDNFKFEDKRFAESVYNELKNYINTNFIKGLDQINIITGPGSFTGLRTGFSLMKGILMVKNIEILFVDRFELLEFKLGKNLGSGEVIAFDAGNSRSFVKRDGQILVCENDELKGYSAIYGNSQVLGSIDIVIDASDLDQYALSITDTKKLSLEEIIKLEPMYVLEPRIG